MIIKACLFREGTVGNSTRIMEALVVRRKAASYVIITQAGASSAVAVNILDRWILEATDLMSPNKREKWKEVYGIPSSLLGAYSELKLFADDLHTTELIERCVCDLPVSWLLGRNVPAVI